MPSRPKSTARRTFWLYILGDLDTSGELTTFAEYRGARALEAVRIGGGWRQKLAREVGKLRSFIEGESDQYTRAALAALGESLFELILKGEVRDLLLSARTTARLGLSDGRVPFQLVAQDPRILAWPWEYMRHKGDFICREFHPISRGVFTSQFDFNEGPRRQARLSVLLMSGVEPGDPLTKPGEQKQSILNAFRDALGEDADRITITVEDAIAPEALAAKLRRKSYDVVHFYGHGGFDSAGGYLRLKHKNKKDEYDFYGSDMRSLFSKPGTRLVFLNACETGAAGEGDRAQSSVANELMRTGVPAVIATQFKMPVGNAQLFAGSVYRAIAQGKSLTDAMAEGRSRISYITDALFVDWGIPVLYTSDPNVVLFAPSADRRRQHQTPSQGRSGPRVRHRVALADLDADVGFLPDVVAAANRSQRYFAFEVRQLPIASGYVVETPTAVRSIISLAREQGTKPVPSLSRGTTLRGPQLYVPWISADPKLRPRTLGVDLVCALTNKYLLAIEADGELVPNLFSTPMDGTRRASLVSTARLRKYAKQARVSSEKAALFLCLGTLVDMLSGSRLDYHKETAGCLMDQCEDPDDLVAGLRRMRFDHEPCRKAVDAFDPALGRAIDAILARS
jgi:hypothetical protein